MKLNAQDTDDVRGETSAQCCFMLQCPKQTEGAGRIVACLLALLVGSQYVDNGDGARVPRICGVYKCSQSPAPRRPSRCPWQVARSKGQISTLFHFQSGCG